LAGADRYMYLLKDMFSLTRAYLAEMYPDILEGS